MAVMMSDNDCVTLYIPYLYWGRTIYIGLFSGAWAWECMRSRLAVVPYEHYQLLIFIGLLIFMK